jgi:hypothetical protein
VADRGTPSWPKITIRLYDTHNGEVKIAGRSHPLVAADPREAAIAIVAERAGQLGRPVRATAVEADGTSWPLIIHPDGQVDALDADGPQQKPIWPILVAAGIAVVLVTATVLYLAVFRDKPVAQPTGPPTLPTLPSPDIRPDVFDARPYPPGFSTTATWSVDLAENTSPAVSADETKVAIITPDHKIAMLNGAGQVLWQDHVPESAKTPVFTTIDDAPVVAIPTDGQLYYWPVEGGFPNKAKLASGTEVQFFGPSPMLTTQDGPVYVISGGKWVPIPTKPRRATILYADGKRVLMAGYYGPLFWGEPEKDSSQIDLRTPPGATTIDHIVMASPGKVISMWKTKDPEERIPAVHNADNGALLAACKPTLSSSPGDWVPDAAGKVAALGPCLIDFAKQKTYQFDGFQPVSTQRTSIYGNGPNGLTLIAPGGNAKVLPEETARPWGIVAGHAIVVHQQVLYALAQPKGSR